MRVVGHDSSTVTPRQRHMHACEFRVSYSTPPCLDLSRILLPSPPLLPSSHTSTVCPRSSSPDMYPPSRSHSRSRPHTPNQQPSSSTTTTSTHNVSRDSEESDWSLPYASHSFSHSRPPSTS